MNGEVYLLRNLNIDLSVMYLGPSEDLNNTCDCISKQDSKSLYTFSVSVAKTQDGKDKPKCGGVELVNTLLKRGKNQ